MNERTKELAEQAGFEKQTHLIDSWECGLKELERFAELIRADEREACAALCETTSRENALKHYAALTYIQSAGECANAIRSRK